MGAGQEGFLEEARLGRLTSLQRYLVGAGLCLSLQVPRSQSGPLTGLGPGSHTNLCHCSLGQAP